jgi:adenine phosphoribosyltransferase
MAASGRAAPDDSGLSKLISARIRDIPDYPKPGILFKDITPLLADASAFAAVVTALADGHRDGERGAGKHGPVDKVAGIEARGFIFAAPVARELGAGFVPVRKQGKLPAATYAETYELEYGTATIEMHSDAISPGERVLIIDDVLATGGTAAATASLVRRSGGEVAEVAVVLELGFLHGRARLGGLEIRSLLAA